MTKGSGDVIARTDPEAGIDPVRLEMAKRLYWADIVVRDAIALRDGPSNLRDEWRDEWWRSRTLHLEMRLPWGLLAQRMRKRHDIKASDE